MKQRAKLLVPLFAAASLAGCGLTGDLSRPDPLWGNPDPDLEAAELPQSSVDDRLELPERIEENTPEDAPATPDDELLGGPLE